MTGTDRSGTTPSPLARLLPDGGSVRTVVERSYRAGPVEVWSALTRPERLSGWLGVVSGELVPAGTYQVRFGDGEDEVVTGTVLVCEVAERLAVTWILPDGHRTEVEVALTADGTGTTLRLEHRGLPRDSARGYAAGWHVYLDDLRAVLAGVPPVGTWDERFTEVLPAYRSISTGGRGRPGTA